MRRNKIRAFALIFPTLVFLLIIFIFPIGNLLTRSVDDQLINSQLPLTFKALEQHELQDLPAEEIYETIFFDLTTINKFLIEKNYGEEVDLNDSGWKIRIPKRGPFKESILNISPKWGEVETWLTLKEFVDDNIPWVHFDIAGMAWGVKPNSIHPKGSATGWGVRLVLDMLDV